MRIALLLCSVVASACFADLRAQTIWPQGYAGTNGGSTKATPFSISAGLSPARTRSVIAISAGSLPFSSGQPINGLAFRRDAVQVGTYPGYSATVQVRITSVPDAYWLTASAHQVFQSQHEVFNGTVAIPAAAAPTAPAAAPFALRIPFATPWTYPGGDLAIELTVNGPAGSTWRCDAVELPWLEDGHVVNLGAGCATSAGDLAPMYVEDVRTLVPGGSIHFVADRLVPPPTGALVYFVLGTAAPGFGLGPVGLDPSCQTFINPVIATVSGLHGDRMIDHSRGTTAVSLPNWPGLTGLRLAGQTALFDFGLSSYVPICLTQAIEVEIASTPPSPSSFAGRTQWIYGAKQPGNTQGLRLGPPNHVPVIEFF
ncbi:MAG: hypothetical protein KDC48_04375 [Planctomycetes bacterium]|nr:hypothetical protein [Planctomycetota bacterium]